MRFGAASALLLLTALVGGSTASAITNGDDDDDDDGALYLTPMIRQGRIGEARLACKVKLVKESIESYSGYLTVDDRHGSNMFFWFFPAAVGADTAPVLLWLQGGPGASSLYAVFNEHGPFFVNKNHELEWRDHTWTATHSVLYVDNPVGTGFSFTGDGAGYSADETAVGLNMYEALTQFFTLFSEYRKNDFYVTGESYAGKYVPSVSYTIHRKNPGAPVKINLKGLVIGNGLIDPINQMVHSEYLYQYGFIDEDGKRIFQDLEDTARRQILGNAFEDAFHTFSKMLLATYTYPYPSLFQNMTGMQYYFNMLWDRNPKPYGHWEKYVQRPLMRASLHVGRRPLNNGSVVEYHLIGDVMQSVATRLAILLDAGRYRVLLYSGQLDIIVPYRGTMRMARSLGWSGAEQFKNATRTIWRVRGDHAIDDVAGYATTAGPLTVLLVRDAGHMVPADQPAWSLDMINRFTAGKSF